MLFATQTLIVLQMQTLIVLQMQTLIVLQIQRWGRTRHGCDGAAAARARDLCDALPFSAPNLLACDRDRSDGILRGPEGRGGQFGGAAAVAGGVRLVAAAPLDFSAQGGLKIWAPGSVSCC